MRMLYAQVEGQGALGSSKSLPTAPSPHISTLSIAKAIIKEDGARGLFRGLSVNYLKVGDLSLSV